MGLINVVKTLSQSAGPLFTGRWAQAEKLWLAFVVAGTLKLLYDALMVAMFLRYRTREEGSVPQTDGAAARRDPTEVDEAARDTGI